MARYIDADKLIKHIKDLPTWKEMLGVGWKSTRYPSGMFDCEDIINSIDNQPTADVEEVVRCKDCKYLEIDKGLRQGRMCLMRGSDGWCNDDDFCSYGKRK